MLAAWRCSGKVIVKELDEKGWRRGKTRWASIMGARDLEDELMLVAWRAYWCSSGVCRNSPFGRMYWKLAIWASRSKARHLGEQVGRTWASRSELAAGSYNGMMAIREAVAPDGGGLERELVSSKPCWVSGRAPRSSRRARRLLRLETTSRMKPGKMKAGRSVEEGGAPCEGATGAGEPGEARVGEGRSAQQTLRGWKLRLRQGCGSPELHLKPSDGRWTPSSGGVGGLEHHGDDEECNGRPEVTRRGRFGGSPYLGVRRMVVKVCSSEPWGGRDSESGLRSLES